MIKELKMPPRGTFRLNDDMLVEAMIHDDQGSRDYQPIAFRLSQVAHLLGDGEGFSVLQLQSGKKIMVALGYQDLRQRLYEPDFKSGNSIDLTAVSGAAERAARALSGHAGSLKLGEHIHDQGIFLGQWQPEDRAGNSLGKQFNVFAAPQDLQDGKGDRIMQSFNDAVRHVAALKNWHGQDGGHYEDEVALYAALKDGSAIGKWFVPTPDLLKGGLRELCRKDHHQFGFATSSGGNGDYPHWYWSCTTNLDLADAVYNVNLSSGESARNGAGMPLSCRPVRVVEILRRP